MKQEFITSVLNPSKSVNLTYQLVLFDFDGTLCNTEGVDICAIQKAYQVLNQPIPTQQMVQKTLEKGLVAEEMLQYLSPKASSYFIQQLLSTYKAMYRAEAGAAELFHGAVPLLKQFKERGIFSVVVSNKAIDTLKASVVAMQIDDYFETVVGVRADGLCKPNPMLYERYVAPHFPTVEPHRVLMVGDTSTDLRFAKALKIKSAWASYGLGDMESCSPLKPTYTLQKISDLLDIVLPFER